MKSLWKLDQYLDTFILSQIRIFPSTQCILQFLTNFHGFIANRNKPRLCFLGIKRLSCRLNSSCVSCCIIYIYIYISSQTKQFKFRIRVIDCYFRVSQRTFWTVSLNEITNIRDYRIIFKHFQVFHNNCLQYNYVNRNVAN